MKTNSDGTFDSSSNTMFQKKIIWSIWGITQCKVKNVTTIFSLIYGPARVYGIIPLTLASLAL